MNVQNKEQIIIGTILKCNQEIKNFLNESISSNVSSNKHFNDLLINLNESVDLYHYNLTNLFKTVCNSDTELFENYSQFTNNHKNYYAYFNKVYNFLNEFETNIQVTLNESLIVDSRKVKKPKQLNIVTFKNDLKNLINYLEKQNDISNYSKKILNLKTFLKQPIYVCGYNLTNNDILRQQLFDNFKITEQNLLSICFNQNNKQLFFVTPNTNNIVVYDLKSDVLDNYNKVNKFNLKSVNLKPNDYLNTLKQLTGINSIYEIYVNPNTLNFKFEDNLYKDNAYRKFREELDKNQKIFK